MPLVELAAVAAPFPAELLPALLGRLVADGAAVETGSGFARADAGGALPTAQEELARRLADTLAAAGFSPPTLALLLAAERLSRRQAVTLLEVLARRGELVRVKEDLWFSTAAVGEARERLLAALARRPQITLAEFRDLLSAGRRNAQALLEYFDREGLTRRVGEARELRGRQ
jgi:selenocysteine-specific elongation factor